MADWKSIRVESGECVSCAVGPLTLWLKRVGDELHVAARRAPEEDSASDAAAAAEPEDVTWGRWIVGDAVDVVRLVPALPDRPVVVRPESPVKMPTGSEALFYVSIPVWVRLVVGEKTMLCEEPTVALSGIWFGDPMSGDLCYTVPSRARRTVQDAEARPHRAICPVRIRNVAPGMLEVQRLCIHTEYLSVYGGGVQLWTNEVRLTSRGEDQASQVDYADGPVAGHGVGERVCEPRKPIAKGLLKKSFSGLKSVAGM